MYFENCKNGTNFFSLCGIMLQKGRNRKYDTNNMGILPGLPQQNKDKNPPGHGSEKPYCFLPEVQKRECCGYKKHRKI